MLNLYKLSEWARLRAKQRINTTAGQAQNNARAFTATNQPFHKRLLDACQRVTDDPKSVPDALFIALPERLLGKIAYLCLGEKRGKSSQISGEKPDEITEETISCLNAYDSEGHEALFINLDTEEKLQHIKHILLCHGLSPIEDSILLLADLGRAFRASWILNYDIRVMLADITWMSSNRSIRQFSSLSEKDIDTGLRVCLDKRERLYKALSIASDTHQIVSYDRKGTISGRKLKQISSVYLELAKALWGTESAGRLDHELVKRITKPLYIQTHFLESVPQHIRTLSQFPGVLNSLEDTLKSHLEILRVIAKQFNSFDEDVLTYFFAQYYAQDSYRSNVIKIAPVSERAFDEPFDKLDTYFRAWGEGHSTNEILTTQTTYKTHHLSALYFPQYSIGKMSVLPYTPLSLDALKQEKKDHNLVKERFIMLTDLKDDALNAQFEKNLQLLRETPLIKRNRLVSDISSFIMMCLLRYKVEVNVFCEKLGYENIENLLTSISPDLPIYLLRELEAQESEAINGIWMSWFENIQADPHPEHIPFHFYFLLLEESDWNEQVYKAASAMLLVSHLFYQNLT
jgi:hypothetical protein